MDHQGGHSSHQEMVDSPTSSHSGHGSHKKQDSLSSASAHSNHSNHSNHRTKDNHDNHDVHGAEKATAEHQHETGTSDIETLTVDSLQAIKPTTLPTHAKVHELRLVLGGDMERYIWHINGKAIQQDRLIYINKNELIRITFENDTMMHHPMHLHGHFFRVLNGKGELSPLKHTVDVEPHGKRVIEFYANEPGQWMLHCHNLYHMKTGMARIIRYKDFILTPEMLKNDSADPHNHDHQYYTSNVEVGTNHAQANFKIMKTWDELDFRLETAAVDGKNLSKAPWESEGDIVYRRWFSNFFNFNCGVSLYDEQGYAMIGIGYILPLLIHTELSITHNGKFRFDAEKRLQLTKTIYSDLEFTWRPSWNGERDTEYEISLMYAPDWS